ncbi:MAG TPA: glycerol-3-phosphate dehydrogenase [Gemmatimonadales bacterium]|nr:glycerol-3-phosphate dehydrogenase [Gemmatimonadales bacterium]
MTGDPDCKVVDTGARYVRLSDLDDSALDLLVIGGGITGAGIARDAAMRGINTMLVEQLDLAAGTSSRSSRLVHGGLRYLEQGNISLVREALHERAILLRIAPHLVRSIPFIFPLHEGDRVPRWKLGAGLVAYELLAGFRNVRRPRILGKRGVLQREPLLRERGLTGGALYGDAQCDDARLVIATARSAVDHGATVLTHTRVTGLIEERGRVTGAALEDRLAGTRRDVRATIVFNATGPWTDELRRMEDPVAPPMLRLTRGTHVVVPRERVGHRHAITFLSPIDGRVMFILPWGDLTYIGTTDTDYSADPSAVAATRDDVVYLLRSANALFPAARLTEDDVRSTWAGLRPLLAEDGGHAPSAVSREHALVEGSRGMLTIAGGKLTTYRAMAAEAVDLVADRLRRKLTRALTDVIPLPGGNAADLEPFRARGAPLGLPAAVSDRLVDLYGTECAGIHNLGMKNRTLFDRLHPTHPAIEAEVLHAVRREMALTVEDVMVRRLHLYYETRDHGLRAAERVAQLMAGELGWSAERIRDEVAGYWRYVARGEKWR